MKLRNLEIILMLVAGIISSIISLINGDALVNMSIKLIFVLIIFFTIGLILQKIINKIIADADRNEKEREKAELDEEIEKMTSGQQDIE